jgi:hypothetical protein
VFTDRNSIAAALEIIKPYKGDAGMLVGLILVAQALDRLTERIGTLNEIVEQRLA